VANILIERKADLVREYLDWLRDVTGLLSLA